jgi:hypothetical protein
MRPSFLGFIANAILMTILLVLIINKLLLGTDTLTTIYLLALLSVVISLHTIHHYIEEIVFGFNPLRGKWKVEDE